eukprot:TCALIF_12729-PA protein Name:"Protein of unknown function" AED:0.00 eAED:0.00 QI:77/1/0.5/1/1/0.5/2/112/175
MGPMEILLVFLLFLLWFYALRRIYKVWTNILNFSDISSDSFGQRHGWDAFIQWALEHIRGKKQSANQRRSSTLSPGSSRVGQSQGQPKAQDPEAQEATDQVQLESHCEASQRIDGTKDRGDNLPCKSNKIRHHSIVIVDNERGNQDQSELDVPEQLILTEQAQDWSPQSLYQSQV